MNVSEIVRAALTGHAYAGRCPDNADPDARDSKCPSCRVLMEAEGRKRSRKHKWESSIFYKKNRDVGV